VDKCWSDWQKSGTGRFAEYSGRNSDMSRALKTDRLADIGASAGFVLDHRRNLCYDFATTGVPQTVLWDRLPPPPTGGGIDARTILLRAGVPSSQIPPAPPSVPLNRRSDDEDGGYEPTRDEDCLDDKADLKQSRYNDLADDRDHEDCEETQPVSEPEPYMMRDLSDEDAECAADEYMDTEPLRHPAPISEKFMRMNNIPVEAQRAREQVYCAMVDKVNHKVAARKAARKAEEPPCEEEAPEHDVAPEHEEKEQAPCEEEAQEAQGYAAD
jgi:hypothetical protein